jgi:hypothetical protein
MGFGGLQFIPDGGIALSHAIDDVLLRLGPAVYVAMMSDDAVKAAIDMLTYSIMGDEIHVEPAVVAEPGERVDDTTDPERKNDIEKAKRYAEEFRRSIDRVPNFLAAQEAILVEGLVWGAGLGDPAWEVVQGPGDKKPLTLLKSLTCRSYPSWAMVVDKYGEFVSVIGYSWEGPKRFDRDRFQVYINSPRGNDPRGTSDLRAAYDAWNFKQQARPEEGKWLATFSNPTVVITYDGNVPPDYAKLADGTDDIAGGLLGPQAQAERVAANVHGASWMAIPEGWKAELVSSPSDGGAFNEHEERRNKAIFQAILLSSRTLAEASHGSKADSESSSNTSQIKVVRREREFGCSIRHLAYLQTFMNGGKDDAERLCPRIKFPEAKSVTDSAMITAWGGVGWSITPRQTAAIDADLNLPPRTADEIDEIEASKKAAEQAQTDALKAKAQGPAGGGPPGQGKPGDGVAVPAKPPAGKVAKEATPKPAKALKASASESTAKD